MPWRKRRRTGSPKSTAMQLTCQYVLKRMQEEKYISREQYESAIAEEVKLFVKIVDDPLTAVARGCGFVLESVEQLKSILVSTDREGFL